MTNQFDGLAEADAILTRAKTLFGGRVIDGDVADDEPLALNTDGSVKPFGAVIFGSPIAAGTDRGLGDETTQPHILTVAMLSAARDAATARVGAAAFLRLFVGWHPSATAGEMQAVQGYEFLTASTPTRPSRVNRVQHFKVTINL